eukprot:TRINITY_DN241906_c0_g1_i2.p1 TRINITY_DN241906_c0_g1~~TRINITY_DN241906_c0_g1_i2.p1  ORF type:complete len:449 (-),score=167.01 TRINITY_DN241906_c0_g1_i2:308-1564(-)
MQRHPFPVEPYARQQLRQQTQQEYAQQEYARQQAYMAQQAQHAHQAHQYQHHPPANVVHYATQHHQQQQQQQQQHHHREPPMAHPGHRPQAVSVGMPPGVYGGIPSHPVQHAPMHNEYAPVPPAIHYDEGYYQGENAGGDFTSSEEWGDTWISWFCGLQGHQFLCEVDPAFIESTFNLFGLKPLFADFRGAVSIILDDECSEEEGHRSQEAEWCDRECSELYGHIHARYILTYDGLNKMIQKYRRGDFGFCPRILCKKCPALPIGITGDALYHTPEPRHPPCIYCPNCGDIYSVPQGVIESDVDAFFFGSSFPHLMMMTFPDDFPKQGRRWRPADDPSSYQPRLFGFKLYDSRRARLRNGEEVENESEEETEEEEEESSDDERPVSGCNPVPSTPRYDDVEHVHETPAPTNGKKSGAY